MKQSPDPSPLVASIMATTRAIGETMDAERYRIAPDKRERYFGLYEVKVRRAQAEAAVRLCDGATAAQHIAKLEAALAEARAALVACGWETEFIDAALKRGEW